MNKEQKAERVEEIASDLQQAGAIFAVDYRGISVPQAAELRGRLAESDATVKIVKNRLAKLPAEEAEEPPAEEAAEPEAEPEPEAEAQEAGEEESSTEEEGAPEPESAE